MNLKFALRLLLSFLLPVCSLAGCGGDGFCRVPVSGTVTVDGDSNIAGSLVGTADMSNDTKGTNRPNVSAPIENGKFTFVAGTEPAAGEYVFEVSIYRPGENTAAVTSQSAPGDEMETGSGSVMYQTRVTIPEGGSENLAIELSSSDKLAGAADAGSGER